MEDVEAMLEGRALLPGHLNEVLHQGVLGDCEGLRDDDVVPVREQGEGELHEVQTSRLIDFINAEQIDYDGIGSLIGDFRQLPVFQIAHELLVRAIVELPGVGRHPLGLLELLLLLQLLHLGV
jgi:hypothetical protein